MFYGSKKKGTTDIELCLFVRKMIPNLQFSTLILVLALLSFHENHIPGHCLNGEGLALLRFKEKVVTDPFNALSNWVGGSHVDPCSWFGIECCDGKVAILNLKDLCLKGTLAPELRNLPHLKSIILRNNSFHGNIPEEIAELKNLEVLDLGRNNFSGQLSFDFTDNFSLSVLLLDNNDLLNIISPELHELKTVSEYQVDEIELSGSILESCKGGSWKYGVPNDFTQRRLLQLPRPPNIGQRGRTKTVPAPALAPSVAAPSPSPFKSPSASPSPSSSPALSPLSSPSPSPSGSFLPPSPSPSPSPAPSPVRPPAQPPVTSAATSSSHSPKVSPLAPSVAVSEGVHKSNKSKVIIGASVAGASLFVIIVAAAIVICRNSKMVTVKPWATGLSGQLRKAFVTGVPKLKRSELEAACEEFSNIIGSLSDSTVYKGNLSNGVEIAVVSSTVKCHGGWSRTLEAQFRKKIETLSRVNHKNFVNLIGYCEEEKPFTRMMVFEYAPNGTLFEHLHIKEAERLDWGMRLRIVMGTAYCLDHMHQLDPPVAHRNLQSSSVYLTEDYAAKISDFSFWTEVTASKMRSPSMELLGNLMTVDLESNVYSFGLILFEVITGKMPYSADTGSLEDWAFEYLRADELPHEMIDPTLSAFEEEEVCRLFDIIQDCVHPDPRTRPTMREVASRLKEMTGMEPDGATPKVSPLWWAELEILSTEGA